MARKTKQDWYLAGLEILNSQGHQAMTIDALTTRLQVTKGSFYHHFGNFDGFKQALLAHFEEAGTLQIIEQTETAVSPAAKLHRLIHIVAQHAQAEPSKLEVGLRAWAQQDKAVRQLIARVDAQRIQYVQTLLTEHLGDAQQAQTAAELFYCVLIGSEQIIPPLTASHIKTYLTQLAHLYGVYDE